MMPVLEVKARRIGGSNIPGTDLRLEPTEDRHLHFCWLTMYSRQRGEKTQEERL